MKYPQIIKRLSLVVCLLLGQSLFADTHPLRLSLCEIEYKADQKLLSIQLKLFLTDVTEALVFDPQSKELAFCQPNEPDKANQLLLRYLDEFFYVIVNGERLKLQVEEKKLSGEGDNTALGIFMEYKQIQTLESIEIKNAVFTDLFFDQSNIVYLHANGESKSLMLNKKTSTHQLTF